MRRWVVSFGLAVVALSVAWLGYGCGETSFGSCADNGTCAPDSGGGDYDASPLGADGAMGTSSGSSGSSGADGTVPQADANGDGGVAITGDDGAAGDSSPVEAAACDPGGDPKDEACLVANAYGVFVSASAPSGGTGTRAAPFTTIATGITAAATSGQRVFVCAGTYPEELVVGVSADGVAVYGGFDCTGWNYAVTNHVVVAPTQTGYALEVDSLVTGATFEDMEFDAQTATDPGASSVAVFANQSTVTFRRVAMLAGDGAAGAEGSVGANYPGDAGRAEQGNNADGGTGGPPQVCNCASGDQSVGGAGGSSAPTDGSKGHPLLDGGQAGVGGTGTCFAGSGNNGVGTTDALFGAGATTMGSITLQGWSPAPGAIGGTATVAQGGGGGGGNTPSGGAAGGCGGCGGGGGAVGQGGGASFALLSFASAVTLDSCELVAGAGAGGGQGGAGQAGQLGGYSGNPISPGCPGGSGGNGGGGGGGGGGAGGVSAAIGYSGTAPTQVGNVTTQYGTAASGGQGGAGGGTANSGGMGINGMAGPVLSL